MNKVKFSGHWDKNKAKKKSKGVPLVITFHPLLKDVGNIIHKNLYLLYTDRMITLIILTLLSVIQLVNGMVLYEGATTTLDHLVQKSLRYKQYR